ncbi:DUF1501 domain-containing protein [Schlesneria paludicola]|uniref:DUF1501 domain-containing protein n=1 Tax=Schlesneria paludicola TaxID=360056 RepID=UPI00029AEB31|nr:DUF1501 domain-containing protein [Schlesneria paludicola]
MDLSAPVGMSRRHFAQHLLASAATIPALEFISHVKAHAADLKKKQKACILMWMSGGPPTIDIWDLKPDSKNGGEFKPIGTKGDLQISELMPKTAGVMNNLSVVRAMSTREADHGRGRYYMHTTFVPNPTVVHPAFGSVVSYELAPKRKELEIPSFISIGGGGVSPGYLGMTHSPFLVDASGRISNTELGDLGADRLNQRLAMHSTLEDNFIRSDRGEAGAAHKEIYKKAVSLMQSEQMTAFKIDQESKETLELYTGSPARGGAMGGGGQFGRSLLMARRLVEKGVPFVEVDFGGWDLHSNVFNTLKNQHLPSLDAGIAALTTDLKQRGLFDDVVVVWMGEFSRTPRINKDVGRDHWANSWSVMIGGGGLKGGQAIGETDADGVSVVSSKSYQPGDVWATVAHALGIPLDRVHKSKNGRPMKLANGGTAIQELI